MSPLPVLAPEVVQPLMLALPWMNLMSLGHWLSQYPVPYLAPALSVEFNVNICVS